MKAQSMHEADKQALRFAGFLGHPFVVLVDSKPPHPARTAGMECSWIKDARQYADDESIGNPTIYRRTASGWKPTK